MPGRNMYARRMAVAAPAGRDPSEEVLRLISRAAHPGLARVSTPGHPWRVSETTVQLTLDDSGLATDLPRPQHPRDEVQQVPYRPVQFRDDDLPAALERSAAWLRAAQQWLGEPLDVIAIHLDYDDRAGSAYYEVKLLCNEEDLAGAPLAIHRAAQESDPSPG